MRLNKVRLQYGQIPYQLVNYANEDHRRSNTSLSASTIQGRYVSSIDSYGEQPILLSFSINISQLNGASHSYSAPGTPADNAAIEHWWGDFKAIWIAHLPKAQTLIELEHQVNDGIKYFTDKFIPKTRNDLTATELRFGKAK